MRSYQFVVKSLSVIAVAAVVWMAGPRGVRAAAAAEQKSAEPAHRVVVCYFHRTERCPTCRKIGSYVEEAVKTGFPEQVKAGTVSLCFMDFQDAKNKKYVDYYRIKGPTLVLMDVHKGKVTAWKPAPKVWTLVAEKDEFLKHVQGKIRAYLEGK